MTIKTSFAAVLLISLLGLASAQEATGPRPKRARVAEDYQVGTLKELAAKASGAESIGDKQETMLIDPDLSPTRVRATYAYTHLGQELLLDFIKGFSRDVSKCLRGFCYSEATLRRFWNCVA